jgi:hypothetical protein
VANAAYDIVSKKFIDGALNFATADLRVLLVTSGYTFDRAHEFVDDLTPGTNELTGTGYARKTLASKATSLDSVNHRAEGDCADIAYTAINAGTAAAAILFVNVTTDADSYLVGKFDTGGFPLMTNGGDATIAINAEGLLQIAGA